MEVDAGTTLLSGVPVSRFLPCSVTLLQLPGTQGLGCMMEGSSMDQNGGSNKIPELLGIFFDLLPYNNLSRSDLYLYPMAPGLYKGDVG